MRSAAPKSVSPRRYGFMFWKISGAVPGAEGQPNPVERPGGELGDRHRRIATGDAVAGDDPRKADHALGQREGGAGADPRARRERQIMLASWFFGPAGEVEGVRRLPVILMAVDVPR